jgi:phenylalanyl-tRNA synthetase alpha subunit
MWHVASGTPHQAQGTARSTVHKAPGTVAAPTVSISDIQQQFAADLAAVRTDGDLKGLRDKYLGRKGGAIAGLMKALGTAPAGERPALGQQINALKQHIETALDERLRAVAAARRPSGACTR